MGQEGPQALVLPTCERPGCNRRTGVSIMDGCCCRDCRWTKGGAGSRACPSSTAACRSASYLLLVALVRLLAMLEAGEAGTLLLVLPLSLARWRAGERGAEEEEGLEADGWVLVVLLLSLRTFWSAMDLEHGTIRAGR